jgi:OFA family oxalate/formate antiporter-like MFS transporter
MNWSSAFSILGSSRSMARIGGSIKDWTGSLDYDFYISAVVLIIAVALSWVTKRPMLEHEK